MPKREILISSPSHVTSAGHAVDTVLIEYRRADGLAALAGRRIFAQVSRHLVANLIGAFEFPPALHSARDQVVRWLGRNDTEPGRVSAKTALLRHQADAERLLHSASAEERARFMNQMIIHDTINAARYLREITGKV